MSLSGGIAIIAGIAGLVAVFNSNALAAKVYMWTWLPRFLAMVVTEWITHAKMKQIGIPQNPAIVIASELINLLFIVYFVKVSGMLGRGRTFLSPFFPRTSGGVARGCRVGLVEALSRLDEERSLRPLVFCRPLHLAGLSTPSPTFGMGAHLLATIKLANNLGHGTMT